MFFHKFFSRKHDKEQARVGKADKRKGKGKGDSGDDEDVSLAGVEDDSDPEEAEVWAVCITTSISIVAELAGSDIGDDDSLPSDLDGDEDEDNGSEKAGGRDSESLSNGGSELDFIEDEDDIVSHSDGDEPPGLIDFPSGVSGEEATEEEEWQGLGRGDEQKTRKRGREKEEAGTKKKRQRLATFASYEDYAEMIENAKDDDI